MSTQLVVEFSMHILGTYRGGLSNLDETLDDNITYILGRYFFERDIGFVIESLDTIPPVPGLSDELIRYVVTIEHIDPSHCSSVIVDELTTDGYERGCTIREPDGKVLHADLCTPDIRLRRRLRNNAT